MGQKASQQVAPKDGQEVLAMCEVVSAAVAHAAQKLKEYLGFEYPLSRLRLAASTLSEVFLVHFVAFCQERGADEWLTTTKMTKHQASLFGADWIWTFWGPDKQIRLQVAVQTLRMTASPLPPRDPKPCEARGEESRTRGRFDRLEEFCHLVGEDCLGLFIVFSVPGRPKAIRGVALDSIRSGMLESRLPGRKAVEQFLLETEDCVSIKELLGNCLSKRDGLGGMGKVYISLL
ncbi:rab15 effector protein [Phodopus roborovskii]|uniref:Rep15 protein n=1 Tax=Phodopus roborovskii TaxID=109678 RepID=A0AAV0ACI5_PHORO|nr:rab15 effector protein [Phodopus roborovskii]CAH7433406.1 Rep15 [Phodopus roborovskii]